MNGDKPYAGKISNFTLIQLSKIPTEHSTALLMALKPEDAGSTYCRNVVGNISLNHNV
jgi:hypothetical protein